MIGAWKDFVCFDTCMMESCVCGLRRWGFEGLEWWLRGGGGKNRGEIGKFLGERGFGY